jgi:hypothetical protein
MVLTGQQQYLRLIGRAAPQGSRLVVFLRLRPQPSSSREERPEQTNDRTLILQSFRVL